MNPCMYLFVNDGLGMSQGKLAAQTAHAAVEAYRLSEWVANENGQMARLLAHWYHGGHYKKVVLEARDSLHLITIQQYLQDRGFRVALVIDEGRTEIEPLTPTALGVAVVDKDDPHVAATFETFRTLNPRHAPEVWEDPGKTVDERVKPRKRTRGLPWRLFSKGRSNGTRDLSPGS